MMRPLVALVGRPNVGKSTLFNRLVGHRQAIVAAQPGLTRDRLYGITEWRGRELAVVDTAGLQSEGDGSPQAQTRVAIKEAEIILLLLDTRAGLTPADQDVAALLRRSGRPVIVVANKADDRGRAYFEHELLELGLGAVSRISGQHGIGVDDLLDRILELLPPAEEVEERSAGGAKIAI
ncbi:MAG: GTPase, partial [Candidatus Dormibacteraceae bacterium]